MQKKMWKIKGTFVNEDVQTNSIGYVEKKCGKKCGKRI